MIPIWFVNSIADRAFTDQRVLIVAPQEIDHLSEQFFFALKRLGKTVEFLKIAGENDELSRSGKPWNRIERTERIVK